MKKIILFCIVLTFTCMMTGCNMSARGNESSGSGSISSALDSTLSEVVSDDLSGVMSDVISDVTSDITSEIAPQSQMSSDLVSGFDTDLSDITDAITYTLKDFTGAYEKAGFVVDSGERFGDHDAIRIYKSGRTDDVEYQIVVYDSEEGARQAMEKHNQEAEGTTAYVRGNAMIIAKNEYEFHDQYMEPFNTLNQR